MARKPSWRRIKHLRAYTISEAATTLELHRNAIRAWIKAGLPVVDGTRPILILGTDIVAFLQARTTRRRTKCGPGEIYCVKDRAAVRPDADFAVFEAQTAKVGRIAGLCPRCGSLIYRCVSVARLQDAVGSLDVQSRAADRRIGDTDFPTVNSELETGTPT